MATKHNGNCWMNATVYACRECGTTNLCDVCHKHDAPRGRCKACGPCTPCRPSKAK